MIYLGLAIVGYAAGWRTLNPPYEIQDAVISSIDKQIHLSDFGHSLDYAVTIYGSETPIEFSSRKWDNTFAAEDTVDMTVQKQFLGGIEGLSIRRP